MNTQLEKEMTDIKRSKVYEITTKPPSDDWVEIETVYEDGVEVFSPRYWQKGAFSNLKDSKRFLLNAPMGSGKSFLLSTLATYKATKNKKLRIIFSVPQTVIGEGFKMYKIRFPEGEDVHNFAPAFDLCSNVKDKSSKLIEMLSLKRASMNSRMAVCSHQTLVAAQKESPECFTNVLVIVDEAHHVSESENELGSVVSSIIENEGVELGLATATFFRGDKLDILSEEFISSFDVFHPMRPTVTVESVTRL